MTIYFDNASTTFPKPSNVIDGVMDFLNNVGGNPSRGASFASIDASRITYNCRKALCSLFNFNNTSNVVFTYNITYALNMLIRGIVKKGFHVITSSIDHNATLRTLKELEKDGVITLSIVKCDNDGVIDLDEFKNLLTDKTKLVVMSHSSNIIGTIQDVKQIGSICRENSIYFILDSAQTAGVIPIDFEEINCSALAFTGHKSLFAPQGIGGFIINDELNKACRTIITGGTGSDSSGLLQPEIMPDKFESGTMNTPAIKGLLEGINFINSIGLKNIHQKEMELYKYFVDKLTLIPEYKIFGNIENLNKTPVVSFIHKHISNEEIEFILNTNYNISCRVGLHCAPLAHKSIGSFPKGTIRFSFGYFNSRDEIDIAIKALKNIN